MTLRDDHSQPDSPEFRALMRRRWWLFVLLPLLLPGAVYVASARTEKQFEAAVTLQVQSDVVDTSLFTSNPSGAATSEQALAATAGQVKTLVFARSVSRRIPPPSPDPRKLRDRISVRVDDTASFLTISVRESDPARAARVANVYGAVAVLVRTQEARDRIDRAVADVAKSVDRLPARDSAGRRQLSQQLQRLRAIRAAQGSNVTIIEQATPPDKASSPKPLRNTLLAVVLALLLAGGLAFGLEKLDGRIRDADELLRISPVPLLTSMSSLAFKSSLDGGLSEVEAFHRLRVALEYLRLDDPIRSVVVTSPSPGDGKTTVAAGLARAAARAGDDVLLIDADLRLPQINHRFELPVEHGLAEVLLGRIPVRDAIQAVSDTDGRLDVLASKPVEHPWELVASERMRRLVTELSEDYDLVVIDTPPVLVVSDALPLCERVSGVVMVARVNHTRREALLRAIDVVSMAQGTVVGVAVTDVRKQETYGGYGDTSGRASPPGSMSKPKPDSRQRFSRPA